MSENPYARYERMQNSKLSQLPPVNAVQPTYQKIQSPRNFAQRGVDGHSSEGEEKVKYFEGRLSLTERANQTLLEELIRMQGDFKNYIRRTDEALQSEQASRQALETAMLSSRDYLNQTTNALKRSEEKRAEDRDMIGLLVGQVKVLEQQLLLALKESTTRRDVQAGQLEELYKKLEDSNRSRESMERLAFNLQDELQRLNIKYDVQQNDFASAAKEFKNRSSKLEFENKLAYENLRKTSETQSITEFTTIQLKTLVDQRLLEVNDAIADLRMRQDGDKKESKNSEIKLIQRINEISSSNVSEMNRRRDETLATVESLLRERDSRIQEERRRVESQIAEIAEDVTKKQISKDARTREELMSRINSTEMSLNNEVENRERMLKSMKSEVEMLFEQSKRLVEDSKEHASQAQQLQNKRLVDDQQLMKEKLGQLDQKVTDVKLQEERKASNQEQEKKRLESDLNSKILLSSTNLQSQIHQFTDKILYVESKISKIQNIESQLTELTESQKALSQRSDEINAKLQDTTEMKNLQNSLEEAIKNESSARLNEIELMRNELLENKSKNAELSKRMQTLLEDLDKYKNDQTTNIENRISNIDVKLNTNTTSKIDEFNLQLRLVETRVKSLESELEAEEISVVGVPDSKEPVQIKEIATDNIEPKLIAEDPAKPVVVSEEEEEEESEEEEEEKDKKTVEPIPQKIADDKPQDTKTDPVKEIEEEEEEDEEEEEEEEEEEIKKAEEGKPEPQKTEVPKAEETKTNQEVKSEPQKNEEEEEEEDEEDEEEDEEEEEDEDSKPEEVKPVLAETAKIPIAANVK